MDLAYALAKTRAVAMLVLGRNAAALAVFTILLWVTPVLMAFLRRRRSALA